MTQPLHTIHVRVNDAATGEPTPVRIQFTDENGTYYAPFGRFTEFSTQVGLDLGGNILLNDKKYAYIDGACEIQLPSGRIFIEVHKGPEYQSLSEELPLTSGKMSIRLEIKRWSDLRQERWYSGDVGVQLITPHAALLEGAGEDVAVVNLLIVQIGSNAGFWSVDRVGWPKLGSTEKLYVERTWHEEDLRCIPNLLAFSGQHPALEKWGCMVVVNTCNDHLRLGALSLLNCHRVVYPLSFGEPIGFDNWALADWCDQCHRKGGIVVWPPSVQVPDNTLYLGEAPADAVLGKVDTLEFCDVWEKDSKIFLKEWYGLLNLGLRLPLSGGSGKNSNQDLLGGWRTYARLQPGHEFNYKNWIEAVRAGRTFATKGPLLLLPVNGQDPGAVINLESPDQSVHVKAGVRRAFPPDRLELIVNGKVAAEASVGVARPERREGREEQATPFEDSGRATHPTELEMEIPVPVGGWIAAAYWGCQDSQGGFKLLAHTSPVYVQVAEHPPPPDLEAGQKLLNHFDEMLEWVRTQARVENEDQRKRLAHVFESAKEEVTKRLGQRS